MTRLFFKYASILISIWIVSAVAQGVYIKDAVALVIMGLVLLIVSIVLKPIFLVIALPLNILTLGLFSIIVNVLTLKIADGLVSGVHIGGFLSSLAVAFLITVLNSLLINKRKPARP